VLHGVSKTRGIWLSFCHPHLSPTESAPQTLHLERPIELYTSHDLEFLFLRLKSADIGWRTDSKPTRKREIRTAHTAQCMYLVEGGRWLLFASNTGCITYFDLDASILTESVLIPDQFDACAKIHVTMAIDRDNDSALLAFNLAVSFCLIDTPPPDPKAQGVQIWRVELALDDQQRGIGLTVKHLASFPLEPSVTNFSCQSIGGPHVALSIGYEDYQQTSIIDWKQADGDQMNYPRRLLHLPSGEIPVCLVFLTTVMIILIKFQEAIHILPGNKLFAVTREGVMIFDYSSILEKTSLLPVGSTDPTITPLWRASNTGTNPGLQPSSISKPFFCSRSIRFSFRERSAVHGVIIDYPYNECPMEPLGRVVKFAEKLDIYTKPHECYGYNKAAILSNRLGAYSFNYTWPDEQNDDTTLSVSLHTEDTFRVCDFGPFLDEQSGRVVVPANVTIKRHRTHDRIDIWDFALLYK